MQENENMKVKSKKKLWIAIICIVLVIAIVSGVLIYFATKPKDDKDKEKSDSPAKKPVGAHAYLVEEGKKCGYKNAFSELSEAWVTKSGELTYSRYQQNYKGIPVYGQTVVGVTDKDGEVISVTGNVEDVNEEISTTPTVKKDDVNEKIKAYLSEEYDITDAEINYDLSDENLCIYGLYDYADTLCYDLDVEITLSDGTTTIQMIVNATNGNIIYADNGVRTERGELTGDGDPARIYKNVSYTKEENGVCKLIDSERNITALVATNVVKDDAEYFEKVGYIPTWKDGETVNQTALDAFANIQISYDYFKDVLEVHSFGSGQSITLYTNIQYWGDTNFTNNAFYNSGDFIGIGQCEPEYETLAKHLDIMAHEYMHGVENHHSNMDYIGESGALMEALSDIFGELVEAWHLNKDPDWKNKHRNHITPNSNNYPERYFDEKWESGDKYNNSAVITHAAYLMYQNGLTTNELAHLWYNAMLMMTVDCNFYECREYVELAARNLGFDDGKQRVIEDAFDSVGIETDSEIEEVVITPDCELYALDFTDAHYDYYSYSIWSFDPKAVGGDILQYPTNRISLAFGGIREAEPIRYNFKEGVYLLELRDDDIDINGNQKKVYKYLIVNDDGEDVVEFDVDFGLIYIQGKVTDAEKKTVDNACIRLNYDDGIEKYSYTAYTNADGKYKMERIPYAEYDTVYAQKDTMKSQEIVALLERDNVINFELDQEFNYDLILPYLELFYSCTKREFGMETGSVKYYAIADTFDDAIKGAYSNVVSVSEFNRSDAGDYYANLKSVSNFDTKQECIDNLKNHFTGDVYDYVLGLSGAHGMYEYNGKLYCARSESFGLGDPPSIFYTTSKWIKQSDTEYIVTVQAGYNSYQDLYSFTFVLEDQMWKISEFKSM